MKKFLSMMTVFAAVILSCGCGNMQPAKIQSVDTAMGTVIQQNIYSTDKQSEAAEEILALLHRLEEEELSRRLDTSEVWAANEAAGKEEGILLSPELSEIIERSLEIWRQSGGAFDVTMGPVVQLWNIDGWASGEREGSFELPEKESLCDALEHCGSEKLQLDGTRLIMQEEMQLDFGAVGKGIALDRILAYLQKKEGITGAIISAGGSVLTYGEKPDGTCWKVGIVNPADTSTNIGVLSLEGQWCVSTSGDYERYVEKDGIRYHHIINPATGYPADSGGAGVTILSKDGFLSDALSTACFILGKEAGMKLAESYDAEVLFVEKDGSISMTEGMRAVYTENR